MLRTVSCKYTSTPRIGDCLIIMSIILTSIGFYAFGIAGGRLEHVRLVDLDLSGSDVPLTSCICAANGKE